MLRRTSTWPTAKSSPVTTRDAGALEFLDFMNTVVAAYPEREIHVVLDNLSTHKPKRDIWLKRHKTVRIFHYTPTHASTGSAAKIEIWFSQSSLPKSLDGVSLHQRSPTHRAHRRLISADYNQTARPFIWTKSDVRQKRLKPCFA